MLLEVCIIEAHKTLHFDILVINTHLRLNNFVVLFRTCKMYTLCRQQRVMYSTCKLLPPTPGMDPIFRHFLHTNLIFDDK